MRSEEHGVVYRRASLAPFFRILQQGATPILPWPLVCGCTTIVRNAYEDNRVVFCTFWKNSFAYFYARHLIALKLLY